MKLWALYGFALAAAAATPAAASVEPAECAVEEIALRSGVKGQVRGPAEPHNEDSNSLPLAERATPRAAAPEQEAEDAPPPRVQPRSEAEEERQPRIRPRGRRDDRRNRVPDSVLIDRPARL